MTTFDELLSEILTILPDAVMDEDNDGQLVVYTGLRLREGDKLTPFDPDN